MLRTVEALIDEKGVLRILDAIDLPKMRRVIVTILDEEPNQAALDRASQRRKILDMEQRYAEGYAKRPQTTAEVAEWESEQAWEEA
jgi:hypothetical protein